MRFPQSVLSRANRVDRWLDGSLSLAVEASDERLKYSARDIRSRGASEK